MGIFSKKKDFEKDNLRIVFDLQQRQYVIYYYNEIIPYNDLNRKSKKLIDKRNQRLIEEPSLLEKEIENAKRVLRFDKLKSLGYSCDCFEYLGPNEGTMTEEMHTFLDALVNEENVLLGVHRIGIDDSPAKIADILEHGLIVTGHLDGVVQCGRELKNNFSYYPNNKTVIKEILYANAYKQSKGTILIRIPNRDLSGNIFITDEQGTTRLDPKYILGYIPLQENHHIERIIRPHPKNDYTFKNTEEPRQLPLTPELKSRHPSH